jgi:metal-responsive CopG/Arc/MetJ family transcriptional regulator
MAASKIAITIDDNLLKQLDLLVKAKEYPNRSRVIQEVSQTNCNVLRGLVWLKNAPNSTLSMNKIWRKKARHGDG